MAMHELPLDQQHQLLALSLTQRQAKQALIDSVSLHLQRERRRHTTRQRTFRLFLMFMHPSALFPSLSAALLLLSATGCADLRSSGQQASLQAHASLAAALLLISFLNACILSNEHHLASIEPIRRVELWLSRVAQKNSLFRGSLRTASSRSLLVMRDGAWINLHPNLLVRGDVVLLRPGDEAPASASSALPGQNGERYSLAAGEVFAPSLSPGGASIFVLGEDVAAKRVAALFGHETPLSPARKMHDPAPLTKQARAVMIRLLLPLATCICVLAAVRHAIALAVWLSNGNPSPGLSALPGWLFHQLLPQVVRLWLPLLPLALPAFISVAEAYATSHLLATLTGMPLSDGMEESSAGSMAGSTGGGAGNGEGASCGHAALAGEGDWRAWIFSFVRGGGRKYQRQWDVVDTLESPAGLLGKRGSENPLEIGAANKMSGDINAIAIARGGGEVARGV